MTEITLSNETVQYINIAAQVTRARIMDCLVEEDRVVFIVEKGQLGLAIGSKAKNLVKLRTLLKKTVKLVEYDDDEKRFIFNLCKPYKVKDVHLEETTDGFVGKISVEPSDKSKLIGKSGANIDLIRKMAHRHHAVKDIQIL